MASTKLMETKDGRRFFKITVSRGRGQSPYTTRWYWPDGWSRRAAERELAKQAAAFELACSRGEVLTRADIRRKEAEEQAEAAKLKTVRQYADGVYMPTKETTLSENARSSYRMFLDRHILPVLGDALLTEVTPAMLTKQLVDFQRTGKSHATCIKLYNILNGLFQMAFLDDSIQINPHAEGQAPCAEQGRSRSERSGKGVHGWRAALYSEVPEGRVAQMEGIYHPHGRHGNTPRRGLRAELVRRRLQRLDGHGQAQSPVHAQRRGLRGLAQKAARLASWT